MSTVASGPVQPHELPELAAHVRETYDRICRCCTTAIKLRGCVDAAGLVLYDLMVIAMNVDARALVEFFGDRRPHPDDLQAVDFAPEWTEETHGTDGLVELKTSFIPGVNKRLAHLTMHRVRVPADEDAMLLTPL